MHAGTPCWLDLAYVCHIVDRLAVFQDAYMMEGVDTALYYGKICVEECQVSCLLAHPQRLRFWTLRYGDGLPSGQ